MFFPELPITTVSTVSWSIIQVLIQSARSKDIVMTHVLTGKKWASANVSKTESQVLYTTWLA